MINDAVYWFWLYGTDDHIPIDDNSEIAIAALPTVAQEITEANWTCFPFRNIDPYNEPWQDNSVLQARILNPVSAFYDVPTEVADLEKVYAVLRKRYLFLSMDGKDQPEATKYCNRLHTAEKCISVELESSKTKADHKNGARQITLKLRVKKPIV